MLSHNHSYSGTFEYSQTCLFWTPWDPKNCPDDRGVLISHQIHLYTFILQWDHKLTVLISECPQ